MKITIKKLKSIIKEALCEYDLRYGKDYYQVVEPFDIDYYGQVEIDETDDPRFKSGDILLVVKKVSSDEEEKDTQGNVKIDPEIGEPLMLKYDEHVPNFHKTSHVSEDEEGFTTMQVNVYVRHYPTNLPQNLDPEVPELHKKYYDEVIKYLDFLDLISMGYIKHVSPGLATL